jgi:acyl-CoA synthetase (AMP-forming)/AMP-acid ligase II
MTSISKAKTIWEALKDAAQASPDRTGYVFLSEEISFHEMDKRSDRVAAGLLQLGMQKGDRIGIIGLNQPEWIYLYFAAAKIGAVVVGLSVRFRSSEFEYILNHSETSVVATLPAIPDMNYVDFFQQFGPKIPSVKKFIFIGGDGFDGSITIIRLCAASANRSEIFKLKPWTRTERNCRRGKPVNCASKVMQWCLLISAGRMKAQTLFTAAG